MKLYVGNLDHTMTESDLNRLFAPYGRVESVKIITDHYTRQSKNFGYVKMAQQDGHIAMDELNGKTVNNRSIIINVARPREKRQGHGW
ncbi:RNA recognition motif domain-containing protein [Thermodesulfobacteriota bacterium]